MTHCHPTFPSQVCQMIDTRLIHPHKVFSREVAIFSLPDGLKQLVTLCRFIGNLFAGYSNPSECARQHRKGNRDITIVQKPILELVEVDFGICVNDTCNVNDVSGRKDARSPRLLFERILDCLEIVEIRQNVFDSSWLASSQCRDFFNRKAKLNAPSYYALAHVIWNLRMHVHVMTSYHMTSLMTYL
jgi:hypothetical protein